MKPQIRETLRTAREYVRRGYVTHHYAIDASKKPVGTMSANAECWCVAGAIDAAAKHDEFLFNETWDYITKDITKTKNRNATAIKRFDKFSQNQAVRFFDEALGEGPTATQSVNLPYILEKLSL